MIASLPEKASFFSSGDNQIYPLAYSKYVLKSAPGVTVFDVIPTIFKDIKTLYADSSPASVAYNIMKAFSLNLQPVFSSSPTGAKIYNEKPSGLIYAQSNKPLQPSFYMWQVYGLKGILNDTQYYHDFEEREVVGTYLYRFGGYYNSLGRKDIYSYLLDRGAEEAYDSLPVLANIAVLYTSDTTLDKNYAKAELLFKKAEALNPDNTDVLFNFGSFYGTIGLPDKAAKYFERIMKKEPLNFNAKMYYAKAVAQVQAEYDRQVKLGKDQIVHYEAGTQFFNNKKFDEALKEFTLDTRNNPNLPRSYFYIGLIYSMEKNYENAIPMYEKALQFDPNNVGALNNIGLCHMNLKQYKKAAEYFSLSLKIKPGQDRIKKVMEGLGNKI
jgi:tetratricopeptide (TPR) repeat protein